MSIEPKATEKSQDKKETAVKEDEEKTIPVGKRYIQMQQLVAEEILIVLESAYDFIESVKTACAKDSDFNPDAFITQGMDMLRAALDLERGSVESTDDEDEEDDEEDDDE